MHATDPPRSLLLRRSVWKTVSIYPRSAPVMTDLWFVLVPGEALRVKIFPIKGGVPLASHSGSAGNKNLKVFKKDGPKTRRGPVHIQQKQ